LTSRSLRLVLTRLFVQRLYVPCLIVLVLGSTVLGWGQFRELRHHQQETVDGVARAFTLQLESTGRFLTHFGLTAETTSELQQTLRAVVENSSLFERFMVLDPNGSAILHVDAPSSSLPAFSPETFAARAEQQMLFGPLGRDGDTASSMWAIVRSRPQGGTIVGIMSQRSLARLFRTVAGDHHNQCLFLSEFQGDMIFATDQAPPSCATNWEQTDLLHQAIRAGSNPVSGFVSFDNEITYTSARAVPRAGLVVGASRDAAEFIIPLVILCFVIALIFSCFFGLVVWRLRRRIQSQVVDPLHDFTDEMRSLEQGRVVCENSRQPFQEMEVLRCRFMEMAHTLNTREQELRESQERLNLTVNSAGLGLWDWNLRQGTIFSSSRCSEILDFPPYEATTRITQWSRRIHPRDREEVKRRLRAHLLGQEDTFETEFQIQTRDNIWRWVWVCGRIVESDAQDRPLRMTGTALDIAKRKTVEEKLRTLTLAVAQNPVPILITDEVGRLEYANPAYLELTELTTNEVRAGLEAKAGPHFIDGSFIRHFHQVLFSKGHWQGELQNVTKSGRVFWEFTSISPLQNEKGEVTHYVAVRKEVTAQKQAESKLRELATRDSLTGVWNRRYFFELAARELESAQRYKHPLSLILYDIDHFKRINDTYGHMIGDEVLRQLTQLVGANLRNVDLLARVGGEEFAVLLPHTYLEQAHTVARRILRGVNEAVIRTEAGPLQLTISIGMSSSAHADNCLESLIHDADQALYAAKNKGRNSICGPMIGME